MRTMNNFHQHIFENYLENIEIPSDIALELDILESIVTDSDSLLKSIEAKEVDLFYTFKLNEEEIVLTDIQSLYDNKKFNEELEKQGYKKNDIILSDDVETFIENTIKINFFSIFKKEQSELEQPKYIIYQSKGSESEWDEVKCYTVNGDIYNELENKTIVLSKNGDEYTYSTSNSGVNWQLQKNNNHKDTKTFKDEMENSDIKDLLSNDDISITIIA